MLWDRFEWKPADDDTRYVNVFMDDVYDGRVLLGCVWQTVYGWSASPTMKRHELASFETRQEATVYLYGVFMGRKAQIGLRFAGVDMVPLTGN